MMGTVAGSVSTGSRSRSRHNHACSQYHIQILLLLLVIGTLALYSPSSSSSSLSIGQWQCHAAAFSAGTSSSRIFQSSRSRNSISSSFRTNAPLNPKTNSNTMLSVQTSPEENNENNETAKKDETANKFGFAQRIESVKCLVVGGIVGSVALAPLAAIHDVVLLNILAPAIHTNGLAQWEFDSDTATVQAALFAIVYRYCIRQDENPHLNQGVVGSFVLTRTLSRIVVSPQCSAVVLSCGAPLGYFNWAMIGQLLANGAESAAMFGATAFAMDYCMEKGYISKFPG